jgi:hypothetical protein
VHRLDLRPECSLASRLAFEQLVNVVREAACYNASGMMSDESITCVPGPRRPGVLAIVLVAIAQHALPQSELDCVTTKVIIGSAPAKSGSDRTVEHLHFFIDDATKALVFEDGRQLRIKRFDNSWISAERDDIRYEFDRNSGRLTYAGSIVEHSNITTIVGSGRCESH